jgi:predicted ATP-grasp superfamily ATP-dependent carboligase
MEFKRDPRDGKFYLIEPTIGRADWNNAFSEGNGIPIPYLNYLDALNLPLPKIRHKRINRRWIRWSADNEAVRIMRKRKELKLLDWISSIRPPFTSAIFAFDDPLPSIAGIIRRLKRRIAK